MIEKIKRRKQIDNQDKQQPQTIQDLIRRYDLDNIEVKDYLDYLIGRLKEIQEGTEAEIDVINAVTTISDWNTATARGFYRSGSSASNRPCNYAVGYVIIRTSTATTWSIVQVAFNAETGEMYTRKGEYSSGTTTWKDWIPTIPTTVTNENGTATKFPDGTMICRVTAPKENFLPSEVFSKTVQNITIYRSNVYEWTFPKSFIDTDIQVNVTPNTGLDGTRLAVGRANSLFKNKVSIQLLGLESFLSDGVGYTNLIEVYVTAIGRWK